MVVDVDVDGGSVFAVEGLQLGTVTSSVVVVDVDVDCGFSRSVSVEGLQLGT
jgi:hypothetical protein